MEDVFKDVLLKIEFLKKFKALSEKYNAPPGKDYTIEEYFDAIESFGYSCVYNKQYKFYKVDDIGNHLGISIHIAFTRKKVEFILNMVVDGNGTGGSFLAIARQLGGGHETRNPRFYDKQGLKELLEEGFSIYEDIKRNMAFPK